MVLPRCDRVRSDRVADITGCRHRLRKHRRARLGDESGDVRTRDWLPDSDPVRLGV